MKFLVIGLGSMGKRRIRNLQYLHAGEILGFDVRADRRKEVEEQYKIKVFSDIQTALKEKPDAFIISTPPNLHMDYIRIALENNIHFFMELNMSNEPIDALIKKVNKKNLVAAPSCTMRFHPYIKYLKQLIEKETIGKIIAFTYHSGQYLPDWHPWEDYRKFFASQKETGACKEIILFELVWLTWLFGPIKKVTSIKQKSTILDAAIDDVYHMVFEFQDGTTGSVLVDAVARYPVRYCEIIGEKGSIIWDCDKKIVQMYNAEQKKWSTHSEKEGTHKAEYSPLILEDMYVEEMQQFLLAIKGEKAYPYTLQEDKSVLQIMEKIEQSSRQGKHILIQR